jgi:hypothetical protein
LAKAVDWKELDALSDEEIRRRWAWDKDMSWPSEKELRQFDLIVPAKSRKSAQAAE